MPISDAFSLQAAVRCAADDRRALEQPCCYITRPALTDERMKTNTTALAVLELKRSR